MGSHQDVPGNNDHEVVGGGRFYYVQGYVPKQKITLEISNDHIIAGAKRKIKPPARLIEGQPDIPQSDEWRLRKKPREPASTQDGQNSGETIRIIIPPVNLSHDSDDSPLTELEDLDGMGDSASNSPSNDVDVATGKFSDYPRLSDKAGGSQLAEEDGCTRCTGKMINLRHQAQQALLCSSREMASLQKELEALQRQNNRLRAELINTRASQCSPTSDSTTNRFSADELLSQKTEEINRLRRRLSSALEFIEFIRPPSCEDAFVMSTGFVYKEMDILSNYVVYTANSLCRIRNDHVKNEMINQDLTNLIKQTIITNDVLSTDTVSAFRALTFGFIRNHVFHASEIWRDLHFDGIMLRQYQNTMENCISPEILETHHRAAVCLALTKSPEFKEVFVPSYAAQLQFKFFKMMDPLVHSKDIGTHLKRQTQTLFHHAITLRASCYPQNGTRYQLVQFNPGHLYDSQTMRAEDEVGAIVTVPEDGRQRRIKVCVHGLMKAYPVQENATGLSLIKELSQPFILEGYTHGRIISEKAAVILE